MSGTLKQATQFSQMKFIQKPPKLSYPTNKNRIRGIVGTWSIDLPNMDDSDPINNKGYKYILVKIKISIRYGRTVSLKIKTKRSLRLI